MLPSAAVLPSRTEPLVKTTEPPWTEIAPPLAVAELASKVVAAMRAEPPVTTIAPPTPAVATLLVTPILITRLPDYLITCSRDVVGEAAAVDEEVAATEDERRLQTVERAVAQRHNSAVDAQHVGRRVAPDEAAPCTPAAPWGVSRRSGRAKAAALDFHHGAVDLNRRREPQIMQVHGRRTGSDRQDGGPRVGACGERQQRQVPCCRIDGATADKPHLQTLHACLLLHPFHTLRRM